jgi:hypothetical protein
MRLYRLFRLKAFRVPVKSDQYTRHFFLFNFFIKICLASRLNNSQVTAYRCIPGPVNPKPKHPGRSSAVCKKALSLLKVTQSILIKQTCGWQREFQKAKNKPGFWLFSHVDKQTDWKGYQNDPVNISGFF